MTSVSDRGREAMALAQQLGAQLPIVVDLAVADDPLAAVLVGDRLMAAVEIDDRQATLAEDRARADMDALIVGAAMADRIQGATDRLAAVAASADHAGNPTHRSGISACGSRPYSRHPAGSKPSLPRSSAGSPGASIS